MPVWLKDARRELALADRGDVRSPTWRSPRNGAKLLGEPRASWQTGERRDTPARDAIAGGALQGAEVNELEPGATREWSVDDECDDIVTPMAYRGASPQTRYPAD